MGLQSSDIILVERSSTLYRETYGNRANIDSSDLLLVDRGGTLYKCAYSDWPNANSTDLILVERGGSGGYEIYNETQSNWAFPAANVDIHSANYAVPSSKLTFSYGNTGNDTTNFSVFEVQVEVTDSGNSSTGHLYIGVRNTAGEGATAGYPYYGDLPIGAVQVLESDGATFLQDDYIDGYDWNFALGNVASGYMEWLTTDSSQGGTGVITDEDQNPGDPTTGFEFYSLGSNNATHGERRFSHDTNGTGSSWVGAAKGISTSSYPGDMSAVLPVGTENISQDGSGGYVYQECSSTSTGNMVWIKGPEASNGDAVMTLHNGDRIRICYYGGANGPDAAKGLQTSDCVYLRWHEE